MRSVAPARSAQFVAMNSDRVPIDTVLRVHEVERRTRRRMSEVDSAARRFVPIMLALARLAAAQDLGVAE